MHYVVSDIHGCYDALRSALDFSHFDGANDHLYVLGDILDRGPQNAELVNFIVKNSNYIHVLRGNHEDMWLVDTTKEHENLELIVNDSWSRDFGCGGHYNLTSQDLFEGTTTETRKKFFDMIEHAPLLQDLEINNRKIVLVHAGLRPPVEGGDWFEQKEQDLLWIRNPWLSTTQSTNFLTIFGHTPVQNLSDFVKEDGFQQMAQSPKVAYWNNKIDIDCGVSMNGALALMCLETLDIWYTNQNKDWILKENLRDRYFID